MTTAATDRGEPYGLRPKRILSPRFPYTLIDVRPHSASGLLLFPSEYIDGTDSDLFQIDSAQFSSHFRVARSLPALIACNGESMCWTVNETETISFPLKKSLKRFYIQLQKFRFHVTAVGASACVVICVKSCLHTLY